jgi:integrase
MPLEKLSATFVDRVSKPGRYGDGGNLFLRVRRGANGIAKNWLIRWKPKGEGAEWAREMFLGPYPLISLEEARKRAKAPRLVIYDGGDPAAERRARLEAEKAAHALEKAKAEAAAAKQITFEQAALRYLGDNEHDAEWLRSLKLHVFPSLGGMLVSTIELAHVADALRPVWRARHVTARRIRQRVAAILDWCRVQGMCEGDNPARWVDGLANIFAVKKGSKAGKKLAKVEHHKALPYDQAPTVLARVRAVPGVAARALETLALTGVRFGEIARMDWSEIDLDAKVWSIPGERTKNSEPLRVPLSGRVLEILEGQGPRDSGLVFGGERSGAPMRAQVLARVLKPLAGDDAVTVHGWRSTLRVWMAERTSFSHDICEAVLGHIVGSKVSRAYKRTDHLEQRRHLAQMWSDYCMSPPVDDDAAKVVPIRRPS